jgi:YD repeat-containing protein
MSLIRLEDILPDRPASEAPKAKPAQDFKITYAKTLAEPLPPVQWLCHGYSLPRGCYSLVAGESYAGKSLWVTDLALAVAAGKHAMGLHRAGQGRVLWLDYDGQGERITRSRLQRMARARGYELSGLGDQFGYVWLPDIKLDSPNALEKFSKLFEGVALAVIDSWRGACPKTEEKDRGQCQRVGETIMKIIEKTGVTPMMIDHTTKPARDGMKSTRSAMHDIHGSTAKTEMAQWVAIFEAHEGKPVKVIHTKERAEARKMAPFWLQYEDVANENDRRWGLRVNHLDREQITSDIDPRGALKQKILIEVRRSRKPISSKTAMLELVGGRKQSVLVAIDELVNDKILIGGPEGDGPFYLPRERDVGSHDAA